MALNVDGTRRTFLIGQSALRRVAPLLRATAMECIADWSVVERSRLFLVTAVVQSNRAAIAREIALRKTPREQRDLVKLLGNAALRGQERELFFNIIDVVNDAEEKRNHLAHGLWAVPWNARKNAKSFLLLNPQSIDDIHTGWADLQSFEDACQVPDKAERESETKKAMEQIRRWVLSSNENKAKYVTGQHDAASLAKLRAQICDAGLMCHHFEYWRAREPQADEVLGQLRHLLRTWAPSRRNGTPTR